MEIRRVAEIQEVTCKEVMTLGQETSFTITLKNRGNLQMGSGLRELLVRVVNSELDFNSSDCSVKFGSGEFKKLSEPYTISIQSIMPG